ncbi:MAG: 1-acyl-sn-glycerol-3-phosphate acyltransferase [Bacilli bacterium]|nr:1-acyl-sn-glycerol-3-phosphate acyltransferase [Bacilli bacterium]
MKENKKVIYYSDELNDDFAENNIKKKPLGKSFKYVHRNPIYRFFETILYYIIALPLVWLMQKFYSHQKFVNRKVFKKAKKTGYFIYSNHTQMLNDAYIGSLASVPKKCFVIANPDATSIRGLRLIVQALGAIPLGTTMSENISLMKCIEKRMEQKSSIMIFPEAHIWPYYTKIRNFKYQSFRYPSRLNKPIFVLTNCYQKRKWSKKPKILTYVDGPFYPDNTLSELEAAKKLRDIAYNVMTERTKKYSTYEYIKYIKKKD